MGKMKHTSPNLNEAARRFMDLFIADGDPPILCCDDIDAQELASRFDALSRAIEINETAENEIQRDLIRRLLDKTDGIAAPPTRVGTRLFLERELAALTKAGGEA